MRRGCRNGHYCGQSKFYWFSLLLTLPLQTALQGNSLIETTGETNASETETTTETTVEVGRRNAVAQVLIMLGMIMLSIEHEVRSSWSTSTAFDLNYSNSGSIIPSDR